MGMALPKAMTLTDSAADRVRTLVAKGQESAHEDQILGLRVV